MSGEKSQLTPLEARKQLLLVESELNRVQLLDELRDFNDEIHHLKHQVFKIGSIASLAATFSRVARSLSHRDEGGETLWISRLLNCALAGTSLWRLFRSCWRKA